MEKQPRLRAHERVNPYISEYAAKLGQLSLVDDTHPELGWRMDLTSGMPVPVEKDEENGTLGPPDIAA